MEVKTEYTVYPDAVMTHEQLMQFNAKLRQVCAVGYGEVAVVVRDGHVSLMTVTVSERLALAKDG